MENEEEKIRQEKGTMSVSGTYSRNEQSCSRHGQDADSSVSKLSLANKY